MPTFSQLPSGKWRAQVRRRGLYRAATFQSKREAREWAATIESQGNHIAASGYAPVPRAATVSDLIDKYTETIAKTLGRSKEAALAMLQREIGAVKLVDLNAVTLRDFIDRRQSAGAGGVTIAADLSFLSAVLRWARRVRRLDVNEGLAREARGSLSERGLETRSKERSREPTDAELDRLYVLWRGNDRQRNDMVTICKFALATGMRQGEICRLQIEDVNRTEKTVVIHDRKDPRNKQGNDQVVPLLPNAWKIVQALIADRTEGRIFEGVTEIAVSAAFTRACQKLDPPILDLRFHDLRHRATAEFFRMGLDIPRVALLTGHKTWAMLRRYTAIKPSDVHLAVARHAAEAANITPMKRKRATGAP
jgi:integrase